MLKLNVGKGHQVIKQLCSRAVLPKGLRINPYFTDISSLSWTTDGYQQHQLYMYMCIYRFLAIQWPAVIVHMRMIIAMSLFDHYVLGYTAI